MPTDAPEEVAAPIYRELAKAGLRHEPVVQTNSVSFLKRLVVASDGVALLPEGAVADDVADGTLTGLPLPGIELADDVGAVWRRELSGLPLLEELVARLREELPRAGLT